VTGRLHPDPADARSPLLRAFRTSRPRRSCAAVREGAAVCRPPKPPDPDALRPFGWLREVPETGNPQIPTRVVVRPSDEGSAASAIADAADVSVGSGIGTPPEGGQRLAAGRITTTIGERAKPGPSPKSVPDALAPRTAIRAAGLSEPPDPGALPAAISMPSVSEGLGGSQAVWRRRSRAWPRSRGRPARSLGAPQAENSDGVDIGEDKGRRGHGLPLPMH
jgi:hypothetical protein